MLATARREAEGLRAEARREAERLRADTARESEAAKAEIVLAAKMDTLKLREDLDREIQRRRESSSGWSAGPRSAPAGRTGRSRR